MVSLLLNAFFHPRHRQSREALELQDILAQEARLGNIRQRQVEAEEAAAKKLKAENRDVAILRDFSEGPKNGPHVGMKTGPECHLKRMQDKL